MRLNKAIAASGLCSRRKADELIAQGRVTVNGQAVQEMGLRIDPHIDQVEVDGRLLSSPAATHTAHVYILLHKPTQVVTTAKDPQDRTTVVDLLPKTIRRRRVVPIGRLDYFSEGLLLLSTDGELVYRLTHPKWHVPKLYNVHVRGEVSEAKLNRMRKGMRLKEGERLAPVQVSAARSGPDTAWLSMRLIQGVNRQIRRMCRDLDLTILKLIRTQEGPISLGGLPAGQTRALTPEEIQALREAVGLQ